MSAAIELRESHVLIRLEGDVNITSARELKRLLVEGLASGRDLHLDLERVAEIDVTTLQLLWSAGRDAARAGSAIVIRASAAADAAARDAGFSPFPGTSLQE